MSDTLVIQSHRSPLPYPWLQPCLDSVIDWCDLNCFDYRFIGDEIFNSVPIDIMRKTRKQIVIATDLARLIALQQALEEEYTTVVWCDADFLIFKPSEFTLPQATFALGREVWIQNDAQNRIKAYKKVHNAFMMFRRGNSFLDYYTDSALQLLRQNGGSMPPQFIGPKLLTALHNTVNCPVLEEAGMLSPLVIRDLIQGRGKALKLFTSKSPQPIKAANLCSSSIDQQALTNNEMNQIIKILRSTK